MNLADFSAISNGNYNLGSIRLQGEGEQASLVKINNHRWLANNVADDPAENMRVRQALSTAIRQEAGIGYESYRMDPGSHGGYWSSESGRGLQIKPGSCREGSADCYLGLAVRPVRPE